MKKYLLLIAVLFISAGCGNGENVINVKDSKYGNLSSNKITRSFTSQEQNDIRTDGLNYLNQLRQSAGMTTYSAQDNLNQSAYNHAHYLVINNKIGHGEDSGDTGFTGEAPSDRVIYAGYNNRRVGENLSSGNDTVYDSIDSLFSAIYHRFGFLSFNYNEIGMGADSSSSYSNQSAYNYNMGNSYISGLCSGSSFEGSGSYTYGVCADESFKIETSRYNDSKNETLNQNPSYVLWPYNNQQDAGVVFFNESPDPLPSCDVSGYPVSVQLMS